MEYKQITIGGMNVQSANLVHRPDLGLVMAEGLDGSVLHEWPAPNDCAFEVRSVITPAGDYLVVVCAGQGHYAAGLGRKENDLIAYRSTDKGKTWTGGKPLWEVPYSQHGFVPVIPRGTERIYSVGTEPAPRNYSGIVHHNRHGGGDFNQADRSELWASLSDDGGRTWAEPRFVIAIDGMPFVLWNSPVTCTAYVDLLVDGDSLHLFVPHNFHKVVHLKLTEHQLRNLPTQGQIRHDAAKN